MEVLIAAEDNDGLQVVPVGRHQQAISVDLAADPCLVTIMGDARSLTADGVVTALVDPESNAGDGFWFFEAASPFASSRTLGRASCLLFSLAHVSAGNDDERDEKPAKVRPTAIVLLSEHADLYLVTTNTPSLSEPDWISWTNYSIPLDTSMPWRVAGSPENVGGLQRLPIDSKDRLATSLEIRETLSSVISLRIRGGQPAHAHLVLLRSLTAIRQVDAVD